MDPSGRRLTRSGSPVAVEPQVFDLLVLLIEQRAHAVPKDEIFDRIWQGRAVSEGVLSNRIRSLRQAIDSDGAPSHVRTVHKVGYQFETEVEELDRPEIAPPRGPQVQPGDRARAAKSRSKQAASVAVLSFDNMSSDPEMDHFADGIAEDLLTQLSKFKEISVSGRNSSFALRGQQLTIPECADALGVRYIVEGSLRAAGKRIRVTVQLIDATEDKHIWAETFDRELGDVFAVQDDVVSSIVRAVFPNIVRSIKKPDTTKPVEDFDAWDHYTTGLWHGYQCTAASLRIAAEHFRAAAAIDPDFVEAFSHLARALVVHASIAGPYKERERDLDEASIAIDAALKLDATHPAVWLSVSRLHLARAEFSEAVVAARRMVQLNPKAQEAHNVLAHALVCAQCPEEAVEVFENAANLGADALLSFIVMSTTAVALIGLGKYEDALSLAREAQREPNADYRTHLPEISALGLLERFDEAELAMQRALEKEPALSFNFIQHCFPFDKSQNGYPLYEGLRKAGFPD